jgi:hypothetical protein
VLRTKRFIGQPTLTISATRLRALFSPVIGFDAIGFQLVADARANHDREGAA